MSSDPIPCPYCNSQIAAPTELPSNRRVTCPRCGESFPYRASDANPGNANAASIAPDSALARALAPEHVGQRWSNRAWAGIVLGIMALMAATGLTYALLTVEWRRKQDARREDTRPETVRSVAPAELAALGYLPSGTNVVVGVHVADALRTPAGNAFLSGSELGNTGFTMANVEGMVGLKRQEIDHVVLGLKLVKNQFPRLVLVVQTRRPYEAAKVRAVLKANRHIDLGGKDVYQFSMEKPHLSAYLWCATPNALVVGITKEDLEAVPATAASGAEQLPVQLQAFLKERTTIGVQAWVAGHAENWDTIRLLSAALMSEENQKAVASIRTFGAWLRLSDKVELQGAVHCANETGAEALEKVMAQSAKKGTDYLKVLGGSAEAEPAARELAQSFLLKRKETWVMFEAAASTENVRKAGEK